MANIMLGFPNLIDAGNLSGGAYTQQNPLSNIQFRQLGRVARSLDLDEASTQFTIDFLQPRRFQAIALVNHNISFGGRWVVEASDDVEFNNLIVQEGADAWAAVGAVQWDLDLLEWENDNFWTGTFALDEIAGLTPLAYIILDTEVQARFVRIRIIDTGNGAGYVDVGRCFIGPAWSPRINMAFGASAGYEDPTNVEVALGGAEYFDERDPYRIIRFNLDHLDQDTEGYAEAGEIFRRAGLSGELLVIPDRDDADNAPRRNFMGRLRSLSLLEHIAVWGPPKNGGTQNRPMVATSFEIKELK